MKNKYLNEFFSFRAAGDILNACGPINNGPKEITEAMAIRARLKKTLLKEPMNYSVIDLCSGNALVPILSAFTLPSKRNFATDKKKRHRQWHLAKRFAYLELNIYEHREEVVDLIDAHSPCIITACHSCKNLCHQIIDIYNSSKAEQLILIPCCIGTFKSSYPESFQEKLGKENLWTLDVAAQANGSIIEDTEIISPRNKIILARK